MGLFDAMAIAASGLTAERVRMDVTAENLANANTTRTAGGEPYRRQEVLLQQAGTGKPGFEGVLSGAIGHGAPTAGGVRVAGIVADPTPDQQVYDPANPDANAQGYVKLPNVSTVTEMTDLISESEGYQSDVTAMQTAKSMFTATLGLLK